MDWLKCNICFNMYNESSLRPRSLTCGHTFCERCLNNTIQEKSLTCPQCRKRHDIHSAVDLPINFVVEGLLKSLNPGSQDLKEGIVPRNIEEPNTNDSSSEACNSLKFNLEEHEKSLLTQKELLKKSAGLCNEHPSMECMLRCSVHKCWVCEKCTEEQGDHPINKCKIISFVKEIEDRRQEHIESLIDDGKSCDETKSIIEKHISHLKDEKEDHTCVIDTLQDLVNRHKEEEESLENEIKLFQNIIEKSENIKQRILNVETTVMNAATLDESNAAKDIVKNNKAETTNWVNTSKKEVNEGKLKVENSTSSAMATQTSLDYRLDCILLQQELERSIYESEEINTKEIKSRCIELTRNPICNILTLEKLTDLVTYLETYATYTHEGCQRWGRIFLSTDGSVLLRDFRQDLPPAGALVINLSDVIKDLPHPRFVYLSFISNGKSLGRVVIRVNEEAPRRAQQFVNLCIGPKGLRYSGSSDIALAAKGMPNERLVFDTYLDTKDKRVKDKLFPDLEKSKKVSHKQGLVILNFDDCADFRILTKSDPKKYWKGPAIAEVVVGMPILEKIAEDNLATGQVSESQVIISESGLVINSSCLNYSTR